MIFHLVPPTQWTKTESGIGALGEDAVILAAAQTASASGGDWSFANLQRCNDFFF